MTDERVARIPNVYHDRLYGERVLPAQELELLQTPEIARLRQVALSTVPPWLLPTSTGATRFEHTMGVAHLARIVAERPEFTDIADDLYFAALAHDVGTPPFSHLSEWFQVRIIGMDHEEYARYTLRESHFGNIVERQGGDLDRILELMRGDGEYGPLLNGSIDIDNLDNSLRWAISMGMLKDLPYSPVALARAFTCQEGRICLDLREAGYDQLTGWEDVRRVAYGHIYSPVFRSPGMMLHRALGFAFENDELDENFFSLTDAEAFNHLKRCNEQTRTIVERASRWEMYPLVYDRALEQVPQDQQYVFLDQAIRFQLADAIADALAIDRIDVAVSFMRDRGHRRVNIPIIGENGHEQYDPLHAERWFAQVHVNTDVVGHACDIEEFMNCLLDDIPARPTPHLVVCD